MPRDSVIERSRKRPPKFTFANSTGGALDCTAQTLLHVSDGNPDSQVLAPADRGGSAVCKGVTQSRVPGSSGLSFGQQGIRSRSAVSANPHTLIARWGVLRSRLRASTLTVVCLGLPGATHHRRLVNPPVSFDNARRVEIRGSGPRGDPACGDPLCGGGTTIDFEPRELSGDYPSPSS